MMSKDYLKWENLIKASNDDVRRLAAVWRFSSIPVCERENVAEHSFWVALYGAMIHRSMFDDMDDLGAIILAGLIHDVPECITGDMVRLFKYATVELKTEVDRAEGILVDRLPTEVKDLMTLSESQSSRYVKAVVKAADFMSLFAYLRREAARGNMECIPFFNRMVDDLTNMSKTSEVIIQEFDFPRSFYSALALEASIVRSNCFKGLEDDQRWTRPV